MKDDFTASGTLAQVAAPPGVAPGASEVEARSPATTLVPWRRILGVVAALAGLELLLLLLTSGRYGYFIDEFYYLACARHLDWGYVDQPPLSIALLRVWTVLFGDGLSAIRVPAALFGAGTIVLTGALARALGADRFGVLLACMAVLMNPVLLGVSHFYSMNAIEPVIWTAALCMFARILRGGRPRLWLWLGLLLGLGLMNKVGTSWLGGGIFLGLLWTRHRSLLRSPWPWLGAGLAALLFLPHVIWQVEHGWPTLEFVRGATREKYGGITRLDFVLSIVFEFHPLALPVWLMGLAALLAGRLSRACRPIGIAWLTVFLILFAMGHGRPHYLSGAMPALCAAGGAALEARFREWGRAWLRPATVAPLALGFLVSLPLSLPLLSPDGYIAYGRALGVHHRSAESVRLEGMPQHVADQIGWPELVDAVAAACDRLGPEERARACIYAPFYGAAGAIELLGRDRALPPVISAHNNYWIWGPGRCDGSVVLHLGEDRERLLREFDSVEPAGAVPRTHAMPYRNGLPIWICRGLKWPIAEIWGQIRDYR